MRPVRSPRGDNCVVLVERRSVFLRLCRDLGRAGRPAALRSGHRRMGALAIVFSDLPRSVASLGAVAPRRRRPGARGIVQVQRRAERRGPRGVRTYGAQAAPLARASGALCRRRGRAGDDRPGVHMERAAWVGVVSISGRAGSSGRWVQANPGPRDGPGRDRVSFALDFRSSDRGSGRGLAIGDRTSGDSSCSASPCRRSFFSRSRPSGARGAFPNGQCQAGSSPFR